MTILCPKVDGTPRLTGRTPLRTTVRPDGDIRDDAGPLACRDAQPDDSAAIPPQFGISAIRCGDDGSGPVDCQAGHLAVQAEYQVRVRISEHPRSARQSARPATVVLPSPLAINCETLAPVDT